MSFVFLLRALSYNSVFDWLHRLHLATPSKVIFLKNECFSQREDLPNFDEVFAFGKAELMTCEFWVFSPPRAGAIYGGITPDLEFLNGFHVDFRDQHGHWLREKTCCMH